jgi:MYXO-CTERM domain-containing protein
MILNGNGRNWPVTSDSDMPFNLRILQLSTSGNGDVVSNNAAQVGAMLIDLGIGSTTDALNMDPPTADPSDAGATSPDGGDAPNDDDSDDTDEPAPSSDDEEVTDEPRDGTDEGAGGEESDDTATDEEKSDDDAPSNASDAGVDVSSEADDDGCGCAVPGRQRTPSGWLALPLLGALLLRRRRN